MMQNRRYKKMEGKFSLLCEGSRDTEKKMGNNKGESLLSIEEKNTCRIEDGINGRGELSLLCGGSRDAEQKTGRI
jgi:hypothetical protein